MRNSPYPELTPYESAFLKAQKSQRKTFKSEPKRSERPNKGSNKASKH